MEGDRRNIMSVSPVSVQLAPELLQLCFNGQDIQQRVTEWLVISLFTEGSISSGKAAELMRMSRLNFLSFLHAHGIAYFHYDADELQAELDAVQQLDVPDAVGVFTVCLRIWPQNS